jgi:hypothetical protein
MSKDGNNDIDVAGFFDNNSSLFVVLGVFSALAIYISELGGTSLENAPIEIRLGFGGALLLSLLAVLLIYRQIVNHVGSVEDLIRAHANFQNWDLIIFTGGAVFLLPSLITPLLQRLLTLYYVIAVLSILFSMPAMFKIAYEIDTRLTDEGIVRHGQILLLSIAIYWLSSRYVRYIRDNAELYGTGTFSLSHLSPVFYDVSAIIAVIIRTSVLVIGGITTLKLSQDIGDRIRGESNPSSVELGVTEEER